MNCFFCLGFCVLLGGGEVGLVCFGGGWGRGWFCLFVLGLVLEFFCVCFWGFGGLFCFTK